MRHILFFVVVLISSTVFGQSRKANFSNFYLEYTSSSKTILIKGKNVTLIEWIDQYENPISSYPSSRKEVQNSLVFSDMDIQNLIKLIKTNGFMELPKAEYGETAENRNYPYSIHVKVGGKEKSVVYRSSPAPEVEQMPNAFMEIEVKIIELTKK